MSFINKDKLAGKRQMAQFTPPGVKFHLWKDSKNNRCEFAIFRDLKHLITSIDKYEDEGGFVSKWSFKDTDNWTFGSLKNRNATRTQLLNSVPTRSTFDLLKALRKKMAGVKSIQNTMKNATDKRAGIKYADYGDELDINRLMCGSHEHWTRKDRRKKGDAVRIHFNYALSCGNSTKHFQKLACLTVVATEMLQRMGKSVEIVAISTLDRCDIKEGIFFTLKKADEALDVSKIASLGCPGLFRDYTFRAIANCLEKNQNDMGKANPLNEEQRKELGISYMIESQWIEEDDTHKQKEFLEDIFKKETGN